MPRQVSANERPPGVLLVGFPNFWFIQPTMYPELGFSWADAGTRRDEFAGQLVEIGSAVNSLHDNKEYEKGANWTEETAVLGEQVAAKALRDGGSPDDIDAFIKERLSDVLKLDPVSLDSPKGIQPQLKAMRDAGTWLFSQLKKELKDKLDVTYRLAGSDPAQEAKLVPLSVQLPQVENAPAAPICFDMLYEAVASRPRDPLQFWGFRRPISQWLQLARDPLIDIRPALTAADGGLPFASQEARLATIFAGDANCVAFECELQTKLGVPAGAADWLHGYLQKLDAQYDSRPGMPEDFEDTMSEVLARGYGLMHFSCHCRREGSDATGKTNPPERHLEIALAGARVRLNRTFIDNRLRLHEGSVAEDDPGGLVFLNACASGKDVSSQFPDLPKTWIQKLGAKAVIATLCDVPDIFAFAFALKLYQALDTAQKQYRDQIKKFLAAGRSDTPHPPQDLYLDSALLTTRRFFMEQYGNPLGLAYQLYAYPGARLEPPLGGNDL